jgi:SGNH domain (fused to AT3 domains)
MIVISSLPEVPATFSGFPLLYNLGMKLTNIPFRLVTKSTLALAIMGTALSTITVTTASARKHSIGLVNLGITPGATTSAVANAVGSSAALTSLSSAVTAQLQNANYVNKGDALGISCDGRKTASQVSHPTPCFFGNLNASKTIVMIGDSNVGNWLPALGLGLANSPYRLAVFMFSGCPLSSITFTSAMIAKAAICNTWHNAIPVAVLALHPVAVVGVSEVFANSGIPPVRKNQIFSNSVWAQGMTRFFNQVTGGNSSIKKILMGTTPHYPLSGPVICLSIHPNPSACAGSVTDGGTSSYAATQQRDANVASTNGATLIPTASWFCTSSVCPSVVNGLVVSNDFDHITIAYSEYLSTVVTTALEAAIQ